jgi:heme exporter protein B
MRAGFALNLKLLYAEGGGGLAALGFFMMALLLFPFGFGQDLVFLQLTLGGVLAVMMLFANLTLTDKLYRDDARDGHFDKVVLSGKVILYYAEKMMVQLLVMAVPLMLTSPLWAVMYGAKMADLGVVMANIAALSLVIAGLTALTAALTIALKKGAAMIEAVVVMPFYIPALIFAAASIRFQLEGRGDEALSPLLLLAGSGVLMATVMPFMAGKISHYLWVRTS